MEYKDTWFRGIWMRVYIYIMVEVMDQAHTAKWGDTLDQAQTWRNVSDQNYGSQCRPI